MTQENKNIQSQVKLYIAKSHDIHIDVDYADWIADIKSRFLFCTENIEKRHHVGAKLQITTNNGITKLHQLGGGFLRFVSKSNNITRLALP